MKDIFDTFIKMQPIKEGLSADKKYYAETEDGRRFLLRLSDASQYRQKKDLFDKLRDLSNLDVPMCRPIDFGYCKDGKEIYQLLGWCEGENLEAVLPSLSQEKQFWLGWRAGEILNQIHTLPAPAGIDEWSARYKQLNADRLRSFEQCGLEKEKGKVLLCFIRENMHLLSSRPQYFHHGDYHLGNLLLTDTGDLSVVDWEPADYDNFGDPWEEFVRIGNSEVHPFFTTGLIPEGSSGDVLAAACIVFVGGCADAGQLGLLLTAGRA